MRKKNKSAKYEKSDCSIWKKREGKKTKAVNYIRKPNKGTYAMNNKQDGREKAE